MSDRRIEILDAAAQSEGYKGGVDMVCIQGAIDPIYLAMDQYFTERALELLEYIAKNVDASGIERNGDAWFEVKDEILTKEQLFENFL